MGGGVKSIFESAENWIYRYRKILPKMMVSAEIT
tara:strand:- start:613 stop:714 length:102 start_codon:yes stop_codon:yes gene_type:complete